MRGKRMKGWPERVLRHRQFETDGASLYGYWE